MSNAFHINTTGRRLNFEMQHWLVTKEALIGCFVSMSFAGSIVELFGDGVALALGHSGHPLTLG